MVLENEWGTTSRLINIFFSHSFKIGPLCSGRIPSGPGDFPCLNLPFSVHSLCQFQILEQSPHFAVRWTVVC